MPPWGISEPAEVEKFLDTILSRPAETTEEHERLDDFYEQEYRLSQEVKRGGLTTELANSMLAEYIMHSLMPEVSFLEVSEADMPQLPLDLTGTVF